MSHLSDQEVRQRIGSAYDDIDAEDVIGVTHDRGYYRIGIGPVPGKPTGYTKSLSDGAARAIGILSVLRDYVNSTPDDGIRSFTDTEPQPDPNGQPGPDGDLDGDGILNKNDPEKFVPNVDDTGDPSATAKAEGLLDRIESTSTTGSSTSDELQRNSGASAGLIAALAGVVVLAVAVFGGD